MAEEQMESPTVEEPQEQQEQQTQEGQPDIEGLMNTLEQIGVNDPKQLEGMATASQQAGNLGNMLGQVRQENAQLKQMLEELKTNQTQPRQQPQMDYYDEYTQPQTNTRDEIRSVLRDFYNEEIIKPQRQASAQFYQDMSSIQTDEDFGLVKDQWNQHINNPEVVMKVQTGQSNMTKEYNKVVRKFYRGLAMQARDAVKNLKGQTPGQSQTVHQETGQTTPPQTMTERDEKNRKLSKLKEGKGTGGDADIDTMLDAMFPKGDPFLQTT